MLLAGVLLLIGMTASNLPGAGAEAKDRSALPLKGCKRMNCQETTTTTAPTTTTTAPTTTTTAPTTTTTAPTTTTTAPTATAPAPTGTVIALPSTWHYAVNTGTGCPASTSSADDITDRFNTLLKDKSKVDNATVQLAANGCYRLDRTIWVDNSLGLTIEGAGATFQRFVHAPRPTTGMFRWGYPHFVFAGGSNLTIRNLSVKGLNTTSFVNDSNRTTWSFLHEPDKFGSGCTDNCFESGFIISPMNGLLMENLTLDATFGDGITLGGEHDSDIVRNGLVRNVDIDRNGRQGVSPTTVDGVVLDDVNILHGYAVAWDTEVNGTGKTRNIEIRNSYANVRTVAISVGSQGAENIYLHDNVIRGTNPSFPWAVFDNGPVSGIRLINNQVPQKRDETPAVVLVNASGINEISGNVTAMNEPPVVRQSNRYGAVLIGKDLAATGQSGVVTGTVVIKSNDFTRYTDVLTLGNSIATVVSCGNRLLYGTFSSPTAC